MNEPESEINIDGAIIDEEVEKGEGFVFDKIGE
jgi:hypothetical protein